MPSTHDAHPGTLSADVIVVGAGLAGATAAHQLARQGIRVMLADPRPAYPSVFKAEKIEPDQVALFRKFGLMDALSASASRIHEIVTGWDGRAQMPILLEQYGIFYKDMVDAVRASLPPQVDFRVGRVKAIVTGNDVQRVTLDDGSTHTSRVVALACGTAEHMLASLGLRRVMVEEGQSLAFGFNIARSDGRPFPHAAVTYFPTGCATRIAFLTLFPIGSITRANLFVFWSPTGDRTRSFLEDPRGELLRWMPELTRLTGEFEVVGRVETGRIDLYQTEGHLQPGLVLLGDTFENVCPTTGTGVSKVLVDVDVFCHECVPEWLKTPGMGVDKIGAFYATPRKQEADRRSRAGARDWRTIALAESLRGNARRTKHRWRLRLKGWWGGLRIRARRGLCRSRRARRRVAEKTTRIG